MRKKMRHKREKGKNLNRIKLNRMLKLTLKELKKKSQGKLKKQTSQKVLKKRTMDGNDPKLDNQYKYHSTPALGPLGRRKGKKQKKR